MALRVLLVDDGCNERELAALALRAQSGEIAIVDIADDEELERAMQQGGLQLAAAALRQRLGPAARERERLLEQERAQRLEAERANRRKDAFLATLSHELRTPLNAILGWATLLGRGAVRPGELERIGQIIGRNARLQAQLIDDLLDLSRIEAGKLKLEFEAVDLGQLIQATVDTVRPVADNRMIRIETRLDLSGGPILADPARLQQVMANLLTNAVKFSPSRTTVTVAATRSTDRCEILVCDQGIGIDPSFLPYLFERFRQADASTTRHRTGLGIGLALVRSLVEAHGGSVRAQSDGPGKGATFVVELPGHKPASSILRPSRPLSRPPTLDGLPVVVVDDEPASLEIVCRVLEGCGARVHPASSAAEGYALVQRLSPRALISDVAMPEEDGYSLVRRVRRLPAETAGRILAVALTACASPEDRQRALEAGFDAHLPKPVDPDDLLDVIGRAVLRPHSAVIT